MLGLIKNEIYKVFRLRKFYLFIGIVLAVQLIKVFQYTFAGNDQFLRLLNGQSFPLEIIRSSPLIMVIFISVLVSDMIADEYKKGTFKLVLLRPVSRIQFISAKIIALLVLIISLVCFAIISSYAIGAIAFKWGDTVLLNGIPYSGNGYAMTFKAALAYILPCFAFGMLVLFIALVSENTGITLALALGLYIISPFIEKYQNIKRYSIINLLHNFNHSILINTDIKEILISVGIMAGYVILLYISSIIFFRKKDVLL